MGKTWEDERDAEFSAIRANKALIGEAYEKAIDEVYEKYASKAEEAFAIEEKEIEVACWATWRASEDAKDWESCPDAGDGYREFRCSTMVEHGGFRGAAHQGFSTELVAVPMRPEYRDGKVSLYAKP